MRLSREDIIGRYMAALPRFFLGLSMFPPHLLTDSLIAKAIYVVLFGLLALLAGKKIRLLYFLTFISFVTIFHLLSPWGRVLIKIGPLTITEGSLHTGLGKAFTLVGIVFLSLAIVRPELRLPGRFGRLASRCLCYFESIFEHRGELTREMRAGGRNVYTALDNFLLERFNPDEEAEGDTAQSRKMKSLATFPLAARLVVSLATATTILIPWGLWYWVEMWLEA